MIPKINFMNLNTNFTARFEPSPELNMAFNQAYFDTHSKYDYKTTGKFINSVDYLLNDGTDDIYKLEYKDYKAVLYKNDAAVASSNVNALTLLNDYVKNTLGADINKPVINKKTAANIANLNEAELKVMQKLHNIRDLIHKEESYACEETLEKLNGIKLSVLG